jgi:hypothetical protein
VAVHIGDRVAFAFARAQAFRGCQIELRVHQRFDQMQREP